MDIDGFRLYLARKGSSTFTIRVYCSFVKRFLSDHEFTQEEVDRYIVGKLETLSRSGVNKHIKALKAYGNFKDVEWVKNVSRLSEHPKPRITFSDTEIEDFVGLKPTASDDQCLFDMYTLFWKLLAYTGARPKEICELTIDDVDLQNQSFIFKHTKTGAGRRVPIPPFLIPEIDTHLKNIDSEYLFAVQHKKRHIGHQHYKKDFIKRINRLGIKKNVKPYSLRHSFITRMLTEAEAPLFVVQDIVGHRDPNTTRVYYHGSVKAMQKAIEKDPLMQSHIPPLQRLRQLVRYVVEWLKRFNQDYEYTLEEKDDEVLIRIKVKNSNK